MNRRHFLAVLAGTPALAAVLAACGDRGAARTTSPTEPTTTEPGTTAPPSTLPAGSIAHPTGADQVVLRLGYEGGFVAPGVVFVNPPTLLVTGDGRVIEPALIPQTYPGPLVGPLNERSISEAGVQAVLRLAEQAGLLATPPDYTAEMRIADAPDTVLILAAAGASYRHQAYALGLQTPEVTPARQRFADFVAKVGDLEQVAGASNLGPQGRLAPTAYRFRAAPVDPATLGNSNGTTGLPAPVFVPWPASTGVSLASAGTCAMASAAKVGALFADANQLTYFVEAGTTYQVAVAVALPGDSAC